MARKDRPTAPGPVLPGTDDARAGSAAHDSGRVRDVPPRQVRAAGVLVGLQALAAVVFVGALVVRAGASELGVGTVLGEAAFFLLVAAAVGAVAVGLVTGRRWARTPALVVQLLLLPVVYSLIGPSRQVVIGLAAGVLVFATFMLLINERSRLWSMGVDGE